MADDTSTPDDRALDVRWRLDGRVALVTGASAGLGARVARVLHQAGANVLVTARRGERLDELASELAERIETMTGFLADEGFTRSVGERTLLARTPRCMRSTAGCSSLPPMPRAT